MGVVDLGVKAVVIVCWGEDCGSGGRGGGGEVVYFTGDSFSRKSRKLGSRSRRGSLLLPPSLLLPQNQPIGSVN